MNQQDWPKVACDTSSGGTFLVDREIVAAIRKGQLVIGADEGQAKYACYELRIGPEIQQLVLDAGTGKESDVYRGKRVGEDGMFDINPGDTFKIFSIEQFYMPADVFAIAIPVGNLYKLGLNPETTFADPGFTREFYVTVCNYSARVVKLKVGDALARVFFFRLPVRPEKIHEGSPREIPPRVARVPRRTTEVLSQLGESSLMADILDHVDPPHYEHAFLTSQILVIRRNSAWIVLMSFFSYLLVLVLAMIYGFRLLQSAWPSFFENMLAEVIGLALGLVIGLLVTALIPPLRRTVLRAFGDAAGKLSA